MPWGGEIRKASAAARIETPGQDRLWTGSPHDIGSGRREGSKLLVVAFCILSLTVCLGAALATGRLRRAALVHGGSGLAGLAALAWAMSRGAPRGPFALDALVLLAAAFAGGLVLYTLGRRRRPRPGLVVLLHGMAGGLAYLLLAGFVFGR